MPTIDLGTITNLETVIKHSINIANSGNDELYVFQIEGERLDEVEDANDNDKSFPIILEPDTNITIQLVFKIDYKLQIPSTITFFTNELGNETITYDITATIPDPPEFSSPSMITFVESETRMGSSSVLKSGTIYQIMDGGFDNVSVLSYDHGLAEGDQITITETVHYNGSFKIIFLSKDLFLIKAEFAVGEWYGTWHKLEPVDITDIPIWAWYIPSIPLDGWISPYVIKVFAATDTDRNPFTNKKGGGVVDHFNFRQQDLITFSNVELTSEMTTAGVDLSIGSYPILLDSGGNIEGYTDNSVNHSISRDEYNFIIVDLGSDWSAIHAANHVPGGTSDSGGRYFIDGTDSEAVLDDFGTFTFDSTSKEDIEITNIGEANLEIRSIRDIGNQEPTSKELVIFKEGSIQEPFDIGTDENAASGIWGGLSTSNIVPDAGYEDNPNDTTNLPIKIKSGYTAKFPLLLKTNIGAEDISTTLEIEHNAPNKAPWKKNQIAVNLKPSYPALYVAEVEETVHVFNARIHLGTIHNLKIHKTRVTLTNIGTERLFIKRIVFQDSTYNPLTFSLKSPISSTYGLAAGAYLFPVDSDVDNEIATNVFEYNLLDKLEIVLNIEAATFSEGKHKLLLDIYNDSDPTFINGWPSKHSIDVFFRKAAPIIEDVSVPEDQLEELSAPGLLSVIKQFDCIITAFPTSNLDDYSSTSYMYFESSHPSGGFFNTKFTVSTNVPSSRLSNYKFEIYYGDGTRSGVYSLDDLNQDGRSDNNNWHEHDYLASTSERDPATNTIKFVNKSPSIHLLDVNGFPLKNNIYVLDNAISLVNVPTNGHVTSPIIYVEISPSNGSGDKDTEWTATAVIQGMSKDNLDFITYSTYGLGFGWDLGSNSVVSEEEDVPVGGEGFPFIKFDYSQETSTERITKRIQCTVTYKKSDGDTSSPSYTTATHLDYNYLEILPTLEVPSFGASNTKNPATNIIPTTLDYGEFLSPSSEYIKQLQIINQTSNYVDYIVSVKTLPISANVILSYNEFTLYPSTGSGDDLSYSSKVIEVTLMTYESDNYWGHVNMQDEYEGQLNIESKQLLFTNDDPPEQIYVSWFEPSGKWQRILDRSYTTVYTNKIHSLSDGDTITINNSIFSDYNGTYEVLFSNPTNRCFDIQKKFSNEYVEASETIALYYHTINAIPIRGKYTFITPPSS